MTEGVEGHRFGVWAAPRRGRKGSFGMEKGATYLSRRCSMAARATRDLLWPGVAKMTAAQVALYLATGVITLIVFDHLRGVDEATTELVLRLTKSLVVPALVVPVVFAWQFILVAPKTLDDERQDAINTLTQTANDLRELLRPRFEFNAGDSTPPFLQIDLDEHVSQVHLRRLLVRNKGVEAIPNVQVRLKSVRDRTGTPVNVRGLPAALHRMNDNLVPYSDHFSLRREGEEYIDVVTLKVLTGVLYVQHVAPGLNLELRAAGCPYIFEIQATGDTVSQLTSTFEVGIEEQATHGVLGSLHRLSMRNVPPQPPQTTT